MIGRHPLRALLLALSLVAAARPCCAGSALADLVLQPQPGAHLPLDGALRDEAGRATTLAASFDGKPVVLVFDYLRCKTICGLALGNLADAIAGLPAASRREARVVALSIDPNDTPTEAAEARRKYLARVGDGADWHFLTGPESAVRPIADAVGFHYRYDAATDQYIHSAGYVVATREAAVSTYLPELSVTPATFQEALGAAEAGQATTPLRRLLLVCFGHGAAAGRYTPAIEIAVLAFNLAGLLAAAAVFGRLLWWRRRDAR
ncbi:MAG: SCO family protein [Alphaproteobacteria bacterium]|nr:SCO family protein [Alphaproteobacteria bacterium]